MRRFSLDLALDDDRLAPRAGDVMVGPRAVYAIVDARPVDSRVWGNRWSLLLRRVGTCATPYRTNVAPAPGGQLWVSCPYRRGERPADHFGAP